MLVGYRTEQTWRKRQKVVVLMELHRAIAYITEMSKQVTKSHVRDAVHMYPVNWGAGLTKLNLHPSFGGWQV
jgi:hypothetical protein